MFFRKRSEIKLHSSPSEHPGTKTQTKAFKHIANNPNIVIRKADKGSCVVVQDTQKYLDKCFKQLSDRRFDMRKTRNLTFDHNKKVHNLVNELMEKGSI